MQGLILQLTRAGFLLLLWLFVWAVLRTLRSDIYAGSGVRVPPRYTRAGKVLPSLGKAKVPRYLVVTQGALAGTRITLGSQPVMIGRADDSTLVLTDDTRRRAMRGSRSAAPTGTSRISVRPTAPIWTAPRSPLRCASRWALRFASARR